ncbi:hypothetical protein RJT34_22778 [Clitoria ternatea]|uniref:Uncharacterized protein n=1 Tax=Clitoria ternatea TaxID=43366 RepID=A0AAN9FM50_CLITE
MHRNQVCAYLLLRHLSLATCLGREYTLLTCSPKVQIIAMLLALLEMGCSFSVAIGEMAAKYDADNLPEGKLRNLRMSLFPQEAKKEFTYKDRTSPLHKYRPRRCLRAGRHKPPRPYPVSPGLLRANDRPPVFWTRVRRPDPVSPSLTTPLKPPTRARPTSASSTPDAASLSPVSLLSLPPPLSPPLFFSS